MARNNRVKNGREVTTILRRNGCEIRNGKGSHRVATMPDGSKLTYHDHGEYGPGIASKITKALVAAGFLSFIVGLVYALI